MPSALSATFAQIPVLRQVLSLELRKIFSYRVDFWFRFLGVLSANVVIAYYLWSAIFAQNGTQEIEGFSFAAMMLYYLLVPLVENISRGQEAGLISNEIYDGTLTRYLVYPLPFFPFKYMSVVATSTVAVIQLAFVLGLCALIFGFPAGVIVTPATILLGIATAVYAGLLNFLIVSGIEIIAFWAGRIWGLTVMMQFTVRLLGGAMLPLALFPAALRSALNWTPFPYMISFPIQTLMGVRSAEGSAPLAMADWGRGILVMTVWILLLAAFDAWLWRRGKASYSGVGQ